MIDPEPLFLKGGTHPHGLDVRVRRAPGEVVADGVDLAPHVTVVIGGYQIALGDFMTAVRYVLAHPVEVEDDPRAAFTNECADRAEPASDARPGTSDS